MRTDVVKNRGRQAGRARRHGRAGAAPGRVAGSAPACAEPRARRGRLALLAAAGTALALLMPCAAWASGEPDGLVERPAARVAAGLLADGVEAGAAATGPKAALDDNGLPDQAARHAAEAAADTAASRAPAAADAGPADAGPTRQAPRTVSIAGTAIGYVDSFQSATAPSSGAGLWMGSDSTTDGSWGYFIGHNPGPFHGVMGLGRGATVTVCDGSGNTRAYHVVDVFTVPDTTCWEDVEGRVTGYGESVILQTCVGDDASYRIVVAS